MIGGCFHFKKINVSAQYFFLVVLVNASQEKTIPPELIYPGPFIFFLSLIGNHFLSPFRLSDFLLPNILQVEQVLFNYRNEKIFHKKTR